MMSELACFAGLLGYDDFYAAVLISTVAVLPLLFIPSFKGLSWLSLIGCCSTAVVVITVAAVVAYDPQRTRMPQQARALDTCKCALEIHAGKAS